MKTSFLQVRKIILGLLATTLVSPITLTAASSVVLGWNNLGMHCMDSDYSVFSILPPYNTVDAQLIVNGRLVPSRGYTVTYQAVADPDGSFNSTSAGKGNFYQYAALLYGHVSVDMGLAGYAMPGSNNIARRMSYDAAAGWFQAEGIPLTPYDNAGIKNPYPLMRLVARTTSKRIKATTDVVLPVSDEMDCRACHASGTQAAARPMSGWVSDANAERDYRLNILKLHDERRDPISYAVALAAQGYNSNGLYAGVVNDDKPVLCAHCHLSEALPGTGYGNISALTAAVHGRHANVVDPDLGITLNDLGNRGACYRCHPGSTTRCLRGAMGKAVDTNGVPLMQCQSCHGSMSRVGSPSRTGWLNEPNCQACHTGTANSNNGQIRYTSVFETDGNMRVPVNQTFATTPNAPGPGLSLYRFSTGHGGMKCSACHGSTHAEFPSSHRNDNIQNVRLQGHDGVLSECTVCHVRVPKTVNGGPHGLHVLGKTWVSRHGDTAEHDTMKCAECHGLDYHGTVLSRAQTDRVFRVNGRTIQFVRGTMIGCYDCHNGPGGGGN